MDAWVEQTADELTFDHPYDHVALNYEGRAAYINPSGGVDVATLASLASCASFDFVEVCILW